LIIKPLLFRLILVLLLPQFACAQQDFATSTAEQAADDWEQLVRVGGKVRERLETEEANLEAAFKRLDLSIELINEHNFSGERLSIVEFREVIGILRQQVNSVVEDHHSAGRTAQAFRKSLAKAQPILATTARKFVEYAEAETYESLREDYLLWAESFEAIAEKYVRRQQEMDPTIHIVGQNLDFIHRTALLLERVETLLAIVPEEGPDNEALLRRLASYIHAFNQLRTRLNRFHQKTTTQTSSSSSSPSGFRQEQQPTTAGFGQFAKEQASKSRQQLGSLAVASKVSVPTFMHKVATPTLNTPDILQEQPAIDLSGVWRMSGKVNIVIGISRQDPGRYTLHLLESGMRDLVDVTGEVVQSKSDVDLKKLTLSFSNGQSVDLTRSQLSLVSQEKLKLTGPVVVNKHPGGYGLSEHLSTTWLDRVH